MTKIYFTLLFCCLQLFCQAQFHLGISAGISHTTWKWEFTDPTLPDLQFGPGEGARVVFLGEWQIKPWIGLRAETGVQQKVNRTVRHLFFDDDFINGNSEGTRWVFWENYMFLENSLLCRISPIKKFRDFYCLLGVSSDWLQYGWKKNRGSESGKKRTDRDTITVNDGHWNRSSLSADCGMGVQIRLDKHSKLNIEARMQQGFYNLAATSAVYVSANPFILQVGFAHRL